MIVESQAKIFRKILGNIFREDLKAINASGLNHLTSWEIILSEGDVPQSFLETSGWLLISIDYILTSPPYA